MYVRVVLYQEVPFNTPSSTTIVHNNKCHITDRAQRPTQHTARVENLDDERGGDRGLAVRLRYVDNPQIPLSLKPASHRPPADAGAVARDHV